MEKYKKMYEREDEDKGMMGHGGGAPGVNTMLQIYPDIGYSVIVLSNFDPPAAEEIAAKARELLLNTQAGVTAP